MGMAMSPFLNSLLPGWVDLFGSRQTARTIHFIVAWLLLGFVFIHVFEVIITGLWNNVRSMTTGKYHIDTTHKEGRSVSYTHLDVYKRQPQHCGLEAPLRYST